VALLQHIFMLLALRFNTTKFGKFESQEVKNELTGILKVYHCSGRP